MHKCCCYVLCMFTAKNWFKLNSNWIQIVYNIHARVGDWLLHYLLYKTKLLLDLHHLIFQHLVVLSVIGLNVCTLTGIEHKIFATYHVWFNSTPGISTKYTVNKPKRLDSSFIFTNFPHIECTVSTWTMQKGSRTSKMLIIKCEWSVG